MTIRHEAYPGSIAKGWVMCAPKIRPNIWCLQQPGCHKDGVTLADITNYDQAELTEDQKVFLNTIAQTHDDQHPDHLVRVVEQFVESFMWNHQNG